MLTFQKYMTCTTEVEFVSWTQSWSACSVTTSDHGKKHDLRKYSMSKTNQEHNIF